MLKSLKKSTVLGLVALGIAFSSVAWFQQSDYKSFTAGESILITEDDYNSGSGGG